MCKPTDGNLNLRKKVKAEHLAISTKAPLALGDVMAKPELCRQGFSERALHLVSSVEYPTYSLIISTQ
jgi:hypothetical protein